MYDKPRPSRLSHRNLLYLKYMPTFKTWVDLSDYRGMVMNSHRYRKICMPSGISQYGLLEWYPPNPPLDFIYDRFNTYIFPLQANEFPGNGRFPRFTLSHHRINLQVNFLNAGSFRFDHLFRLDQLINSAPRVSSSSKTRLDATGKNFDLW